MLSDVPRVPLAPVLARVNAIWRPDGAPHHLIYGMSGSGKTTLIKHLLGLCAYERALIIDPKPTTDPVWNGAGADPWQWGRPIETVGPMFGHDGERGGGPNGMWYRITGSPDRGDTARRFAAAL